MSGVPQTRIQRLNEHAIRGDGDYVLYWMTAYRRAHWNFSLQRAVELAVSQQKPLIVLEALRVDYRWASDRIHQFVIEGMIDNADAFADQPVTYYPYLEEAPGDGRGLLQRLAADAVAIVTDDFPCFFLPRMIRKVASRVDCCFEAIDSNGIYPMRETDRVFSRAHYFRRHLQKNILPHMEQFPQANPLFQAALVPPCDIPQAIARHWPPVDLSKWKDPAPQLARLPIDHSVAVSPRLPGGSRAAGQRLSDFVENKLAGYAERNQPDREVASGLSPYLHFGHVSAHEIVDRVAKSESWHPDKVAAKPNGSAHGWWGLNEATEGFLDELITWRELGYNMCVLTTDFDHYESLPDWAQQTLADHEDDPREHLYSLDEFAQASTHDRVWNAAQRQLVDEGRMHNYLRMLWGKKILEWTRTPRQALEFMVELNNRYALDGRNPNSYSGIFWVLGRYDRAWGPERPIFGKIRYMSSDNTARKLRLKAYLNRYAPGA